MSSVIEGGEQLEREFGGERIAGPAAGSVGLHLAMAGLLLSYAWLMGLMHHNMWGSQGAGGAIQVNLTTALPLPAQEVNQNVLATETPSHAPAPPSPKEQQHIDEKAIPILGKQTKPEKQTVQKTQPHQPQPRQDVAQSGEQSGSQIAHQMAPGAVGQTTVGDNNFASLYPWYVDQINRTMRQNWNSQQVDSKTPKGSRIYMVFTIHRDGSMSGLQLDRSSGSPTLDRSCMLAAQRVNSFGNLPAAYNQSTLKVSYYCEY
ncbi:MAG: TonB C-terminal domain-containing protein [Terracidiphilus sp.]